MGERAFVLSAGLGTRLRPYSLKVPKPLFRILGKPLLELLFDQLKAAGFKKIGLNLHHLPDKIEALVASYAAKHPELRFYLFREEELRGPVGAFYGAASFFKEEPVLVINADILTNFPLKTLLQAHRRLGGAATLLLHHHPQYRNVIVNGDEVQGFQPGQGLAFTGLQVVTPELVSQLTPGDRDLVPAYTRLMRKGLSITALVAAGFYWRDVGTLSSYLLAHEELLKRRAVVPGLPSPERPQVIKGAELGPGVILEDWVFLEPGVRVAPKTKLKRVVAWAGAHIPQGTHVDTLFIPGC